MPSNLLRNLPSVSELLDYPALKRVVSRVNPNVVVERARMFLDDLKRDLQSAAHEVPLPSVSELAERIVRRLQQDERPRLRPVINATGVLLHPELGGPPLAESAIEEALLCARDYASLGMDLASGSRTVSSSAVEELLVELSGCETALVMHSSASALWLTLAALASGRETVISRGQVGEVDGSRLPDLAGSAGATLREVARHMSPNWPTMSAQSVRRPE
jgi:L-seryl-tRNA(Ser) seleniumtransferase